MRLIDADKYLEKVCTYKETGCGSCKLQTMCPKDAPTVEAITIEWIKKYRDQFETTDDYYNVVDYMLRLWEWEKENEK